MATAYTSLLGLALPVTGELSGTWGDTVNTSITALVDAAVAGATTLSVDADVTLTSVNGVDNEARKAILLWTANGTTTTRNITAPARSKAYVVLNNAAVTQSIVLRGAGPTTGVTIVNGEAAVCVWNGSDFVKVASNSVSSVIGTLPTNRGGTGLTTFTAGDLVYFASGTSFTKLGIGTNGQLLTSSGTAPQWTTASTLAATSFQTSMAGLTPSTATTGAITLAGTLGPASGGTGISNNASATVTSSGNFAYTRTLTAATNVTFPTTGTLATRAGTETLTNKTLTAPVISTISNTGTLTLPTTTDTLVGKATTDTLTNKRIDPRDVIATTATTLTPDLSVGDMYAYTGLASALTINAPTGTPTNGEILLFRFLDNGTAKNLYWDGTYTNIGVTLPTTTTANKTTYVGCIYNSTNNPPSSIPRWDVIAVSTQA
jgi:hypothetical protein